MATLVLTVIGRDRPGLVDALSGVIAEHGGNWEQSRMANLADRFAGILLVSVPDGRADALLHALNGLDQQGTLHVTAERGDAPPGGARARPLKLRLVGQDRPGIVHDVSHVLARSEVTIDELSTETRSASMGGGTLFHAEARLGAPAGVDLADLHARLEAIANDLMVEIELDEEKPET